MYTPGLFFWPQPVPQLVTPARYQRLFCSQTRGPPLSPCKEEPKGELIRKGWLSDPHINPITPPSPTSKVMRPEPHPQGPHLAGVPPSSKIPGTHHPWGKVAVIDRVVIALLEVDEVDLNLSEEGRCLLFSEVNVRRKNWKPMRLCKVSHSSTASSGPRP